MVVSARKRVLNTPGLVEHILISADIRTILNCQRVNRFFRNVTKTSKAVKRAMWLIPDPYLLPSAKGKAFVNPMLLEHCEEVEWPSKRRRIRADYPDDFLMSLLWSSEWVKWLGLNDSQLHYEPKTMEERSDMRKWAGKKNWWRQTWKQMRKDGHLGASWVMRWPVEVDVEHIGIVTNRVCFLQDLLDGVGSWKGMILFQPNPFKRKDVILRDWVYDKGRQDLLRCDMSKSAVDVTVEGVLRTVLRVTRGLEERKLENAKLESDKLEGEKIVSAWFFRCVGCCCS